MESMKKKRILSFCLVVAMLAGLLPTSILPSAAASSADMHQAAYSSSISVDGTLSEVSWLTYGQMTGNEDGRAFDVLWGKGYIYIGVELQPEDSELTVTVNGKTLTVTNAGASGIDGATAKWSKAVEVKIPFSAIDVTLLDYSQTIPLALSMSGNEWSGNLSFSSVQRTYYPDLSQGTTATESLGATVGDDTYTLYRKYVAGAENVGNRANIYSYDVAPLTSSTQPTVLEFDFEAAKMPEVDPQLWIDSYIPCYGFAVLMLDNSSNDLVCGIANTTDGLYFCLNIGNGLKPAAYKMNKELNDKFHMRIDWDIDGTVTAYVDNEKLMTCQDKRIKAAWTSNGTNSLSLNLMSTSDAPAADGSDDYEITVSNVRMGTCLGSSVLDDMTFEDIAGKNNVSTAVFSDLVLPATWSNSQISNVPVTWTSSNTDVLTNDGKVIPGETNQTVTLTATVTGVPAATKTFTLTVLQKPMIAYIPEETIEIDGLLTESAWIMPKTFGVQNGITGHVYTLWRGSNAYIAVQYSGAASKLALTLGDKKWYVDLATGDVDANGVTASVKSGVVELKVDLAAVELQPKDYNEMLDFQVSITGSDTAVFSTTSAYDSSNQNKNRLTFNNVTEIDHTKDVLFEQTVKVEAMPLGGAYGITGGATAVGYNFWLSDAKTSTVLANLVTDAEGNLTLQIRNDGNKNDGVWQSNFPLGKKIGDTFKLGLLWGADDAATVYVDGVSVGSCNYPTFGHNAAWHGDDAINLVYQNPKDEQATIKVSDLTLTVDGSKKNISFSEASISGDAAIVTDVSASLKDGGALLSFSSIPVNKLDLAEPSYNSGDVAIEDDMAVFSTSDTNLDRLVFNSVADIDHTKDMLFEQTVKVEAMPLVGGYGITGGASAKGYFFWLSDAKTSTVLANLVTDAEGNLTLQIRNDGSKNNNVWQSNFPLGKKIGDTFTLGLLWGADDTATVYVDGVSVGSCSNTNIGWNSTWHGDDAVTLLYTNPAEGQATIKVSELSVTALENKYTSLAEELSASVLLPGVDLNHVAEDLSLPSTFNSAYFGELALIWTSSNSKILSDTGVVRQLAGTEVYVDLTLSASGGDVWTERVTIIPGSTIIPDNTIDVLRVPYTGENVSIDGKTTDEGWNLNMNVLSGGNALGKFGAQWDTENLYLALKTNAAVTVKLNNVDVNMASATVVGDVVEIAIPLSSINVSVTDYGITIPAVITMGSANWQGSLVLTSTDWFTTGNCEPEMYMSLVGTTTVGTDAHTENQGLAETEDGWYMFDHYDSDGNNPVKIRSYIISLGLENRPETHDLLELMEQMNDRTKATYAEFDFMATSMPVYNVNEVIDWSIHYAAYGFNWAMSAKFDSPSTQNSDSVILGIVNTENGLMLVAAGRDGTKAVELNKEVGDYFRVGTRWETNGDVTVFIDGEKFTVFEKVEVTRYALGSNLFSLNLVRSQNAAASTADDFDIYIDNVALGKAYGDSVIDDLTVESILAANADALSVTSDLNLPKAIYNEQLEMLLGDIVWSSTDENVIDPATGKVTQPSETGKAVTLTAAAGGMTKSFNVYVKASAYEGNTLYATNDVGAASGSGVSGDLYFTLDETNNSIIFDQGESKRVNVITLFDEDEYTRLNESVLTVWTSDDNVTYTKVDAFKLLRAGRKTYLYDFEAEGRYVKVHCTHFDGTDADFTGALSGMMTVSYETVFGAGNGEFAVSKEVTVSNSSDTTCFDDAWRIAKADAGIAAGTEASVRVYLGDELLYHYIDGDDLVVRIPAIGADASVTLEVLSGNTAAMDISNKEYVYEVVYGTREAVCNAFTVPSRWLVTVSDDVILAVDEVATCYSFSYDQGMTWTDPVAIDESIGWFSAVGGIAYDSHAGRIIVEGFYLSSATINGTATRTCKVRFIASDDMGKTWYRLDEVKLGENETHSFISYTDPQELSSYDGDGPNVDFVLPAAAEPGVDSENDFGVVRVLYSTDAGITWYMSEDEIKYAVEGDVGVVTVEAGTSESTILEGVDEDGKPALVLYARCQYENSNNFVKTYSYDNGITWTAPVKFSEVYTPNTQPIMHMYNGVPLMVWGGNNVLGGISYSRLPLSIGYSNDGLQTFRNIQDLYSRYSLQGMTEVTGNRIVNQSITDAGDSVLVSWRNWSKNPDYHDKAMLLRIDNFADYFYRTKGVFDSFENTNVKYEGWSISGTVTITDTLATDGSKSMLMGAGSAASRSVPYIQNGSIAFDLYLNDSNADFEVELASAYSNEYAEAAPIAFKVNDGVMTLLGADATSNITFKQGWNTIKFQLNLTEGKATLDVNGTAVEVPVNTDVGDYVCYLIITANDTANVDNVLVEDRDVGDAIHAEPEYSASVEAYSLTLEDSIGVDFYMALSDAVAADTTAYVEFTLPNKNQTKVKVDISEAMKTVTQYGTLYKVTCDVAAKEMTGTISAQVVAQSGSWTSDVFEYDVQTYAQKILDDPGTYEETEEKKAQLVTLVKAMLNYGTAAQTHFSFNTDKPANSILTNAEDKEVAALTVEKLADYTFAAGTGIEDVADYVGATLMLEAKTGLRLYFNVAEGANVTFKLGDTPLTYVPKAGSGYTGYVEISGIVAKDLDEKYTVTVSDGTTTATITHSPLKYCYNVVNGNYADSLDNLVSALYAYNKAADAYFAKEG